MPLSEGRAIKLTTSRYLTPSGRSINGTGIEPDIVVHARDPRKQFGRAGNNIDPSEDDQLQEALRVIGYVPVELSRVSR
jgi:carboxyl-terminal processing protease